MWTLSLLPILALMSQCQGQTIIKQVCSADKYMTEIEAGANIVMGGLFEIRDVGSNGIGCGRPVRDSMQVFEAAKFTINWLNNFGGGTGYINGVKFGMRAFDTCFSVSSSLRALQMLYPQTTSSSPFCTTGGANSQIITGTVGPFSSGTALSVASMAGQLPVSVISSSAAAYELSDKFKYPTFLRTIPSNVVFAKAVVELLDQLQWDNIVVVYVDGTWARGTYEQLLRATYNKGLCVTQVLALDPTGDKDSYKTALAAIGSSTFSAAVLIASDAATRVILEAANELPSVANVQWILAELDITHDASSLPRARGALVVAASSPYVDEFAQYFAEREADPQNNVGNPWFADWYEATYDCFLTGTTNACNKPTVAQAKTSFKQSPWAVPTMKAIFAYVEAVRSICSGSGACQALRNMSPTQFHQTLKNVDFTFPTTFGIAALRGQRVSFDANGDPEVSDFTVYNYNNGGGGAYQFEVIGQFQSNGLTLTKQPTLYDAARNTILTTNPMAPCPASGCENCLLPQRSVTFRYSPGDVVVGSLINAHLPGRAAFTCGEGMVPRLSALVAAEWAVSQFKTSNPTQFRQVSIGSLVADICPDSSVAEGFLTDVLSGNNRLMDQTGAVISYNNIYAFVDQTESGQADSISPILSQYMIPEVQSGATDPSLTNGGMTPYFSRAIPNDEVYYMAVSSLLQRLGWKYVQVATSSMGHHADMTKTFMHVAAKYGICVVSTATYFDDSTMDPYNKTLTHLLSNHEAQVVVVIGDMMDIRGLLNVIAQRGVVGQLQLISGTDRWARNMEYIRDLEAAAAGAIVLDLEMAANAAFNSYLSSLSRDQIATHPFMRELFEITNQCSLDPSTRGVYPKTCDNTATFSIYQGATPYVIESVNAVLRQLHQVITEVCQDTQYSGLCSEFLAAKDIGSRLDVKLQDLAKSGGFGIKNGEGITDLMFYVYNSGGFQQFGQFNTENQRLTSITTTQLGNYQAKASMCSGVCMECQYLFSLQNGLYNMGDWIIAGAFGVSNPGPEAFQPYICGDVRMTNGPQYTMAMMYALQRVNSGQARVSVKGVTFGGLILDHCNNPGRANLMVGDIYAGFLNNMGIDQSRILAWLTDNTASTNEAAELLDPLGIAMVSPSATSATLMDYPTFYRTIQGDTTIASALIKIVKSLGFPYIQVAHSASEYGRGGLNTMMAVSQAEGICVTNSVELSNDTSNDVAKLLAAETEVVVLFMGTADTTALLTAISNNNNARTKLVILMPESYPQVVQTVGGQLSRPIISLRLQRSTLADYNAYINSSPTNNPYFAQYYMKVMNCNLPGYSTYPTACPATLPGITSDSDYQEDNFILSTINAVYAVVDAWDRTIRDICGADYTTPCIDFLADPEKRQKFNTNLKSAVFVDEGQKTFRFLDREGSTNYDILQSNSQGQYKMIGSYEGVSLALDETAMTKYVDVESLCTAPCLGCIMRGLNFSHTAGDVYLAGLFDVHERYLSPFTCGGIQTLHGFLLLEAFHYAIDQVNLKQGQFKDILKGTTLGGVGLDACGSEVRGGYLVSNINNGLTTLAKDGVVITPSKIDAYIGSYGSKPSIYLARILTDLEIPQISYAAGSDDLNDTRIYPFFYRTVPSDGKEVDAILKFLDNMDIRYVQILYEANSNGISAKDDFILKAAEHRICVAQAVSYPDLGIASPETSSTILAQLIEKPAANAVVTFLGTNYVNSMLKAVGSSDKVTADELRFIGSTSWADNQEAIVGAEEQARGSITIKLDADDVDDFERYINSKTLDNSDENPWFEEYYQRILNCYTSKANTMGYPQPCPLSTISLINSPGYEQDPGVVYVIDAVYAAAFAIHDTLKQFCGDGYTAVCQAYRSNSGRRLALRDNLANVNFTDPVGNSFMFSNRSGVASYRFNSIQTGSLGGIGYQQIGSYDVETGMVDVYNSYQSTWDSGCEREDACAECPAIRDSGIRYVFHTSFVQATPAEATTIVAFFDIHKQGVDPYRCGDINPVGFQQYLSFIYTLENVLTDVSRSRYRVLAIDTCSNSLRIDQDLFGLLQGNGLCNSRFDDDIPVSMRNLASVITIGDANTMAASRVLEMPGITYLSPDALSTMLDSKQHLVRTIAPISAMMKTLVSLLDQLGWTYVDVIYEDSADGVYPYQKFMYYANMERVCRGSNIVVGSGPDTDVQNLLGQLSGDTGSKAVIVLGSTNVIRRVFAAANTLGIIDDYVWVLGVEWELTDAVLKEILPMGVEVRIIMVSRLTDTVESFNAYVNALTYDRIHFPPSPLSVPTDWYDEFYQTMFECTISSSEKPINVGKTECNTTKNFTMKKWQQNKYIVNTAAATYAVIRGLEKCLTTRCASGQPLDNTAARADVKKNILEVTWQLNNMGGSSGDFKLTNNTNLFLEFDKDNRWWDAGYLIRYIVVKKTDTSDIVYSNDAELFRGQFNPSSQQIQKAKDMLEVTSQCEDGENGCGCSYTVVGEPQPIVEKRFQPTEPRNYYDYDGQGRQNYDWPIWAIATAVLTAAGGAIAIILFLVLLFAYPKRGGTSILGYMIIFGILCLYAINFAFFVHATEATCGIRRFLFGVAYMITFAPLLIKAIDNWRFGHTEYSGQRYSGISSSWALFLIAFAIVLIQCIIPIMWLILVHPTATFLPAVGMEGIRHDNWWCDPPDEYDIGLVLSFIFVIFIVLVTAVFSALAYDTDRNNYESRWILFGCIATAGCFMVWMIVTTNAGPPYRDAAVTIANFVNATLLLVVVPIRKTVLLIRSKREKAEKEDEAEVINGRSPYDLYSNGNSYANPTFELSDYDNQYVDSRPEEL